MLSFSPRNALLALGASALVALASGCSSLSQFGASGGSASGPLTSSVKVNGSLFGGRQAIYNATVTLYAMNTSTSNYGDTPTQLAQTTTGLDGTFLFVRGVDGVSSSGTAPTWSCPANASTGAAGTADNPELYIVASGGDTSGTITVGNEGSAYNNTAAKLFIALGACNTVNAATLVRMNEGVTAAHMVALQQFFNPANGAFGAPSTNIVGLVNAVATANNLVDTTTGVVRASYTPPSGVDGITMTATPETSKLNTIANILAACVSSTGVSSSNCSTLMSNAVPPADTLASYTTHPAIGSFPAATDTLTAAYYMNINPTESQDYGTTGKLANLYALQNSLTSPFAPNLGTQPIDWTTGVQFSASGTCTGVFGTPAFTTGAYGVAVDAKGNVWFGSSGSTPNPLVQVSPQGSPLSCLNAGGNTSAGRRVAIDSRGNVWYGVSYSNSGSSYALLEYVTDTANSSVGQLLSWPTNIKPSGLAADPDGNIYFVQDSATGSGLLNKIANAATATTPGPATSIVALGDTAMDVSAASPVFRDLVLTASGNFFTENSGGVRQVYVYKPVGDGSYTDSLAPLTSTYASTNYGLSVAPNGNVVGGNTATAAAGRLYRLDQTTGAPLNQSGLYGGGSPATRGIATDGAGNIWTGSATYSASPDAPNFPVSSTYGDAAFTPFSPKGVVPSGCAGSACYTLGGFQKFFTTAGNYAVAIDPSGNVWGAQNVPASSTIPAIFHIIVGAAVPVVGPIVANIH